MAGMTTSSSGGWRSTLWPIAAAAWRCGLSGPSRPGHLRRYKRESASDQDGVPVLAAIKWLRQQLPFLLGWIDADNDPAFMNALIDQWCDAPEQGIDLTRSRLSQSNDQALVEQKNGMLIWRVVGLERLVVLESA